jgi:hypothetical protein
LPVADRAVTRLVRFCLRLLREGRIRAGRVSPGRGSPHFTEGRPDILAFRCPREVPPRVDRCPETVALNHPLLVSTPSDPHPGSTRTSPEASSAWVTTVKYAVNGAVNRWHHCGRTNGGGVRRPDVTRPHAHLVVWARPSTAAPLLPPLAESRRVSRAIALAVATAAQHDGLVSPRGAEELQRLVDAKIWQPRCLPITLGRKV